MIKRLVVDNGRRWFVLAEEEVAFVKVQSRKGGSFMITIPKEAMKSLGIESDDRLKVLVDLEKKRLIYQL